MNDHIAQSTEHVIVKGEPWFIVDLAAGCQLTTNLDIEVYADRQQAIDAVKAKYPDFEPSEWSAPVVPDVVTMRQGRLALLAAGYLDQVSAAIDAIPDPAQRQAAQIEWEYAITINRLSTLTKTIQALIGMTDAQVDELFIKAATL